jgi:hypothetical protein
VRLRPDTKQKRTLRGPCPSLDNLVTSSTNLEDSSRASTLAVVAAATVDSARVEDLMVREDSPVTRK